MPISARGEVGGWVKEVMGIKEDTCFDEYWCSIAAFKSLYCTPEANITLYVNPLEFK